MDLLLASEWHIPPWEIEDRVPEIWVQRWAAFNTERNRKPRDKDSLI